MTIPCSRERTLPMRKTVETAEESNTCSIAFDISDIKVEPVMLDSESEDGVNVDNADNSEICEPGESVSPHKETIFLMI